MTNEPTIARLSTWAAAEEVVAVQETFDYLGLPAKAEPTYEPGAMGGWEEIPTHVLFIVPVGLAMKWYLQGFFSGLGGDDATSLKRFVRELRSRRRGRQYVVLIRDEKKRVTVNVYDDETDEAFHRLSEVDLDGLESCWLYYDNNARLWVPEYREDS